MNTCRECSHYLPTGLGMGECHRYPPQLVVVGPGQLGAASPPVQHTATCGEWAPEVVTDGQG